MPDLVLYLPFDEGRGTIAFDKSGMDNNGTINGATWVDGKYGKALSSDGSGYVTVTNCQALPSNAITVACWVKFYSFFNWWDLVQHDWDSVGGWNLFVDASGTVLFGVRDGNLNQILATKTGLQTGIWYHLVGTYDGQTVRVFVDGVEGTPVSLSNQTLDNSGDVKAPNRLNGIIDEVRIYNRALSSDEIKQLYLLGPRSSSENFFVKKNEIDITQATESFKVTYEFEKKTVCNLDLVLEDVSIQEGDHIEIYATHTDTFPEIFDGYVTKYSKKDNEGEKILTVECSDIVSKFEERSLSKRYVNQTATSILLDILDPFVQEGLIATDYVDNCTITLNFTISNKTVLEAINDLAYRVGWNWYVDAVQQFHFFETGADLGTISVSDLDSYAYRKDRSELVNRVTVLGAKYCYPEDQDMCESTSGWTAGGTLSLKDKNFSLPPQAGKYSICSEANAVDSNYLEYTFPNTLDLSQRWSFKSLNISVANKLSNSTLTEVSLYLFTDSNNYFSSGNLIEAFDETGGSWVNISLEVGPDSSWSKTGNPSWSTITKFRIQVFYEGTPNYVALLVDKFFFADGRRHATWEDTNSQQQYGLCEMPFIVKDSIRTDQECQELAKAIVTENAQPKDILEDMVTVDLREDFYPGAKITIDIPENTLTSKIISFSHRLEDGDLGTEFAIANVTKTSSEVIREHEARLSEQESEKTEPSIIITGPSSSPTTPEQILDNPPGPPSAPTGLTATARQGLIELNWNANTEADLDRYIIFKGTSPSTLTEYSRADSEHFLDTDVTYNTNYYYAIKAVDRVNNISDSSNTVGPVSPLYVENTDVPQVSSTTITAVAEEIDSSTAFFTWIKFTIARQEDAGGYIIGYRKEGLSEWQHIQVGNPASGNPVVLTEFLPENTTYEYHVCSLTKLGQASSWSDTQTVTTKTNDVAPPVPTNLELIPVIDGALLRWDPVSATDFSHYVIYYGTSSPPTSIAGKTSTPHFLWKKKPTEAYTTYYFAVSAVDTANNESDKCTALSVSPQQIKAIDLSIESRPWTADMKTVVDSELAILRYSGSDGVSDITLKFADGSTVTLSKGAKALENGLSYLYWEGNEVKYTTDYGSAVGENKGLLAGIDTEVSSNTWYFANRAGEIAGYKDFSLTNSTTAASLVAAKEDGAYAYIGVRIRKYNGGDPVVIKDWTELQISGGLAERTLTVSDIPATTFDRVIVDLRARVDEIANTQPFITKEVNVELSGTWTFKIWAKTQIIDITYSCIIYYGSSTYDSRCIDFPIGALAKPASVAPFSSYMPTIGTGVIAAKSIRSQHLVTDQAVITQSAQIGQNIIMNDHVTSIESDKIHLGGTVYLSNWRHGSDVTKIDGGEIYTGSVTAQQIASKSITTEKLTVAAQTENMVPDGDFELGDASKEWTGGTLVTNGEQYAGNYALSITTPVTSRAYIPVKPGEVLRASAYMRTTGTAYYYLECYSSTKVYLRTKTVGSTTSTTWVKVENLEIQLETDVYFVQPRLSTAGTSFFDEVTLYRKVDSVDIKDGGVTTRHIRFDAYDGQDPTYEPGKMWWRSDTTGPIKDQLRFSSGTTVDSLAIIPKYPLYDIQAPPENLIPNQSFEIDRDGDGIPDFWSTGGTGTTYYESTDSVKGSRCIRLYANQGEGNKRWIETTYIPVTSSKTYYVSVMVKGISGNIGVEILAYQFKRDKTASTTPTKTVYSGGGPYPNWGRLDGTFTTDSDCQFVRLRISSVASADYWANIRYDDVVLSEMRVAVPTGRVVGYSQSTYLQPSVSNLTWTTVYSLTPNVDTEEYLIDCCLTEGLTQDTSWYLRVYDETAGVYYPNSSGIRRVQMYYSTMYSCVSWLIIIPTNVNGHTLRIQLYIDGSSGTHYPWLYITGWGHSPHTHH